MERARVKLVEYEVAFHEMKAEWDEADEAVRRCWEEIVALAGTKEEREREVEEKVEGLRERVKNWVANAWEEAVRGEEVSQERRQRVCSFRG